MKFKRGLAVLLAALLLIPTLPASAEESGTAESAVTEEIQPEEEGLSDSETDETQETEGESDDSETAGEAEALPETEEEAADSETGEGEEISLETGEEAADSNDSGTEEELNVPENSETEENLPETEMEEILYNTGNHVWSVVDQDTFFQNEVGDAYFEEDGSYTINIPEENPFFPYEVQFTYEGEVTNQWFMTPEDSVEIGGHTFRVSAYFDGTAVTQMSLNVAGDTVIVYPEEKEFTNDGEGAEEFSLLPLEEKSLRVDLSAYTPAELTMVSVSAILGDVMADSDRVIWTYRGYDDYTISESGSCINLSYRTYSSSSTQWEMIAGTADQLDAENIRYIVTVQVTPSRNWLAPAVYTQDEMETRTALTVLSSSGFDDFWTERYDRWLSVYVPYDEMGSETQAYVSLAVNPAVFSDTRYASVRAYEGEFSAVEEAVAGTDITDQLFCTDMTQTNAGYLMRRNNNRWITMVTFDESGTPTGCFPVRLYLSSYSNYISLYDLYAATENGREDVTDYRSSGTIDGCIYYTVTLYAGYAANGTYYERMSYYKEGSSSNSDVTGAYVGLYDSIAEAVLAGAQDIKDSLFNTSYSDGGYPADYSQGVFFTVFVGEDGTEGQEVYRYCVIAEEGTNPKEENTSNSGSSISFSGLRDSDGKSVASYRVKTGSGSDSDDSYAEFNYITLLVGEETDVTSLAPVFSTSSGAKVYTAGSSAPEESGVSLHDFSNGPVQYSVSSEDGNNANNCWLQVVKATEGAGWLYVNSLADNTSNTRVENGVIYSTREVMLDAYHNNLHDILLANMGTEAIPNLSAELVSDVVKLDGYWTLSGNYELAGFSSTYRSESNGELPNLAKVRISVIDGVTANEVSGTLTIKSGDTPLMVLNLTGILGDPSITTEELPQNIVKYVPYGTMIQNNNKYSWNKTSYSLISGNLPAGMEVRPNGEVYGVPTEAGEFTFTVRMTNSYGSFTSSTRTYTLNVMENTDSNVDGATDTGYDLTQRVQDIYLGSTSESESQTLVSVGIYGEFVDIYLDGVKLVEGTDYDSESGSTRITIRNQTLALTGAESAGTHTLGIEFRTQDDDSTLKRAAQNYVIHVKRNSNDDSDDEDDTNSGNENSGSDGSDNNGSNSGGDNNGSNGGNINGNASGNAVILINGVTTVTHTVVSGDTLWKIAEQYYGSGAYWQKIYADNADIISDPNKIYAGQKLKIYLVQIDSAEPAAVESNGNTYTVASGDTLWTIAQKIYGKGKNWRKIYNANAEIIADPERIYAGQVLVIPED